jgi:hypothetical protein
MASVRFQDQDGGGDYSFLDDLSSARSGRTIDMAQTGGGVYTAQPVARTTIDDGSLTGGPPAGGWGTVPDNFPDGPPTVPTTPPNLVARGDPKGNSTNVSNPANQYTASPSGQSGGGRSLDDAYILSQIKNWAVMNGADPSLANDPNYWLGRIKQTGGLGADNLQYWQNAGVGPTAFFNNPTRETNGGYANNRANPGGYDDPSTMAFFNQLLSRLDQLNQPINDPAQTAFANTTMDAVQRLLAAPYSGADTQALITSMMNPLAQSRDQQLAQNKERISARGMLPSSGLLDELNKSTNNSYDQAVATGGNQLAVNGINLQRSNLLAALQALSGLVSTNRANRSEQNSLYDQAVQLASVFPEFDNQRLAMLLQASGEGASSPSSVISGLNGTGTLGLNAANISSYLNGSRSSSLGQAIGYLIGMGGFGG